STKSYAHTRQFYHPAVHADFIPSKQPIRAAYDNGDAMPVELHDGSTVVLRKVSKDYNPTDRAQAYSYLHAHQKRGEIVTGLLYIDEAQREMHELSNTVGQALRDLPYSELCPGSAALEELQSQYC
ncbi:MAG: 2-oxoacid:ferredoxin oxidoreductase subunit beta, partial [Gammaproteobacteria bacterium]|nr:2-oxoacid:ferredoxin oxidoreductase subunit beta [Gammaproteobacteria bacterium]